MPTKNHAFGLLLGSILLLLAACGQPATSPPPSTTTQTPDADTLSAQVTAPRTTIEAGNLHTCALTTTGAIKCWGSAQLGDGSGFDSSTAVSVFGLNSGMVAVSAGLAHTCAVSSGGEVKCWGGNTAGQLGNGSDTSNARPVNVTGLSSGVSAISAGASLTCALTVGGGVKCWGFNAFGQLGNSSTTNSNVPVDVSGLSGGVTAISAGMAHACALIGGGVKCWGLNFTGQLGRGDNDDSSVPVNVSGLSSGVSAISTGLAHTCALTSGGGVKCWGLNHRGQLGNGSTINTNLPVDVSGLDSGVVAISAGDAHTCALTVGGGVKCWGFNEKGQLGNGSNSNSNVPVDVSGLSSGVVVVTTGLQHTCALTSGGAVKCWGFNNKGQLGNGSNNDSTTPVDGPDLGDTTPPTAVPSLSSRPNAAGWNRANVTVSWNWRDETGGSGLDPANCTLSSVVSSEGDAVPVSATCKDRAGNTGRRSLTIKLDKTSPSAVSGAATGTPNAEGWFSSPVSVNFSGTDALSGIARCTSGTYSGPDSSTASRQGSCTDVADNLSSPVNSAVFKYDATPPSITFASRLPSANGAGWNNTDVTVNWNCTDATSGPVSATVSRVVSTEGSGQSATGTCTDNAGNTASNTQTGINIDKTPPTLAPVVSPNPVLRNLPATATPNASDGLSGLASSSCPAVPTSSAGAQSVTCTATDRAGNTGTALASYTVLSSSQALSNLRSQVQGLSGLGFVNRTLLLATLSQAQVFLSNGVRSGAVSSLNTFIGQVDGIRGISGGLTNAQANALIAQANLLIQSINAGG